MIDLRPRSLRHERALRPARGLRTSSTPGKPCRIHRFACVSGSRLRGHVARLFTGLSLLGAAVAQESGTPAFTQDFAAARAAARETSRDLFLFFTGSDWCVWCERLRADVLDQPAFLAGVRDDYVLVELDYPRDSSVLPAEVVRQNARLRERYAPDGYPTVVLADAEGRPYAMLTGYQEGGPEVFLDRVAAGRAAQRRFTAAVAAARAAGDDAARAAGLRTALAALPRGSAERFHAELIAELDALEQGLQQTARERAERWLDDRRRGRFAADLAGDRAAFGRHHAALTAAERQQVRRDLLQREMFDALDALRMAPGSAPGPVEPLVRQTAVARLLAARAALGSWPQGAPGNRMLIAIAAWADARRDPVLFAHCIEELREVRAGLGGNADFLAFFEQRLAGLRDGSASGDFLLALRSRGGAQGGRARSGGR